MPWKPGESGNPKGRPKKGETYTDAIRGRWTPEELCEKLSRLIDEGNLSAIKYVYDRLEGKPKESIEQTIKEMPRVIGYYPDDFKTDTEDTGADTE